jgi:hypothetical protein
MLYVYGMNGPPEVIYIIRHAEKPLKPPLSGVDFEGSQNEHSLLPRGWQRSGALAALFHRDFGPVRTGLRTPTVLVAPSWGHPGKTAAHRFGQIPQQLLAGDAGTVIPTDVGKPGHGAGQHEHHKG